MQMSAQTPGSLDPTFGNGGKTITSISGQAKAYGVELQSDGKIVVGGYSTSSITGKDFALVRYKTDGTLDSTFGTNGIVTTDIQLGSDDVAYSLALQSDGKIILAGYSDDGSDKDAALIRYNSNGSIDSTFGANGIVLTDFDNSQQDEIKVVKIHQLTGKIIVGGASIINSATAKPVVARYLNNGTLDTTFNSTGIRLLWITSLDYQYLFSVEDLAVKSNGKITAVGWREFTASSWDADFWACRINNNGTMDNTFSTDGVSTYNGSFNGHDRAFSIILGASDNFLISGGSYRTTLYYECVFAEVTATGSVGSFDGEADFGSTSDDISYFLGQDNSGRFIMAGSAGGTSTRSFAISRFSSNSNTDNSFGTNGKVSTTFNGNSLNECFDATIQSDDKIVAVGYTGSDFVVARYLGELVPDLDNIQLTLPVNQATDKDFSNLGFNWTDALGANSYELQVDTTQNFSSNPQTISTVNSSYTLNNLLPSTTYYWRVRATDGSNWGAYTNVWSFTTNSLDNFSLISPSNNSTNLAYASLAFDWSTNLGAISYELQVDTTQSFSTNPQTFTTSNTAYTITNLLPEKTYYWRVRASSDGSNWGQYSDVWNFTTKEDPNSAIEELYFSDLLIYPNPVNDYLYIESSNQLLYNMPYKLLNVVGKEVVFGVFESEKFSLDLKNLSPGTYFLKIGESPQKTFKVIKK